MLALIGFLGLSALVPLARSALAAGSGVVAAFDWPPMLAALYPLTGIAAWLVWRRVDIGLERKRAALRCWGWQLLLSGLWPASLYGAGSPALAMATLLLLVLAACLTTRAFLPLQAGAALLLLPYCVALLAAAAIDADRFWFGGLWLITRA